MYLGGVRRGDIPGSRGDMVKEVMHGDCVRGQMEGEGVDGGVRRALDQFLRFSDRLWKRKKHNQKRITS